MRLALLCSSLFLLAACQPQPIPVDGNPASSGADTPRAEGEMCGGIAAIPCGEGLYCADAPGQCVNVADGSGICAPRPEMCTQHYEPVCGCDGETYGNACTAAAAGVSVASEGECDAS